MAKQAKKQTKKRQAQQSGFTLIELLAVITIMGILMMVAIPSISRTIENTRRDTFMNTAMNYISSARTMWLSDSFYCRTGTITAAPSTVPSALPNGDYYILVDNAKQGNTYGTSNTNSYRPYPMLLQQGGTSSWGNRAVTGVIKVHVTGSAVASGSSSGTKVTYSIMLTDGVHGITSWVEESAMKRANVATSGGASILASAANNTTAGGNLGTGDATDLKVWQGDTNIGASAVQKYLCEENA